MSIHMCWYVRMCICTYVYMQVCVHASVYVRNCVCMYLCMPVWMGSNFECVCVCVSTCMLVCVCVRVCVLSRILVHQRWRSSTQHDNAHTSTHTHTHVHTHTHTHTHSCTPAPSTTTKCSNCFTCPKTWLPKTRLKLSTESSANLHPSKTSSPVIWRQNTEIQVYINVCIHIYSEDRRPSWIWHPNMPL